MFEPVHGSAPDIAGRGLANPIAMILSGAMLLRHIGERAAAEGVERAVDEVLAEGKIRTRDLGGTSSTMEVGEAWPLGYAREPRPGSGGRSQQPGCPGCPQQPFLRARTRLRTVSRSLAGIGSSDAAQFVKNVRVCRRRISKFPAIATS